MGGGKTDTFRGPLKCRGPRSHGAPCGRRKYRSHRHNHLWQKHFALLIVLSPSTHPPFDIGETGAQTRLTFRGPRTHSGAPERVSLSDGCHLLYASLSLSLQHPTLFYSLLSTRFARGFSCFLQTDASNYPEHQMTSSFTYLADASGLIC